jgi:hypothetical protein
MAPGCKEQGASPPSKPRRWRRSDGSRSGGRVALRKRARRGHRRLFLDFLMGGSARAVDCLPRPDQWGLEAPVKTHPPVSAWGHSKIKIASLQAIAGALLALGLCGAPANSQAVWTFASGKGTATPPRLGTLLIFAQGVFAVCASLVLAATILFRAVWRELGHSERRRGLPDRARFRRR